MKRPGIDVYEWWGANPTAFEFLMKLIQFGNETALRSLAAARLDNSGDDTVLDLGCGTGGTLPHVRRELDGQGHVVALDFSRSMIRAARDGLARDSQAASVSFVQADGRQLGFPNETFDGVLATLLLTALPDYERVVREAYRVLRPGGRFVVLDGQPFQHGPARLLNPVVVRVLALLTNWYPSAAVHEALEAVFDDVSVETFDAGALYLAVAQKGPEHDSTGDTMRGTTG